MQEEFKNPANQLDKYNPGYHEEALSESIVNLGAVSLKKAPCLTLLNFCQFLRTSKTQQFDMISLQLIGLATQIVVVYESSALFFPRLMQHDPGEGY